MNKLISTLMSFLLVAAPCAQAGLEGNWNTGKENTIVKIHQKDGVTLGEIISSDNPNATAGIQLIKEIKKQNDGWQGKLLVPRKKKWFDASFKRTGDKLQVTVKAGMISQTTDWKIVKPNRD